MENDDKKLSRLDIDKQLWLAKQKELSEYEIIERRKKRNLYWLWSKIFVLLIIIAIILIIYWKDIVMAVKCFK